MTNPENAIEVRNVRKKFRIFYDRSNDLKDRILFRNRNHYEDRWVLNGISFSVKKGEAIGLVGHNGCGKSTTLKLLTKILYPDQGSIEMQGRVSSLIELGAGFHPDMTGRENIYTNASIFGLTRKEIEKRIEEIIQFSELEEFIDNPVRTYSSGMYMRLAFSVAIHVDAKILLIDEILAVGDANFQKKCFDKLREIKSHGTTIVIVSHALGQIEQICETSYWIENGLIRESGIPKLVHDHYLQHMEDKRTEQLEKQHREEHGQEQEDQNPENSDSGKPELPSFCEKTAIRMGTQQVIFTDAQLRDQKHQKQYIFDTEQEIKIFLQYHAENAENLNLKGNFGYGIFREDGLHCYGTNIVIETGDYIPIQENGELEITFRNSLLPAKYFLDIAVHSHDGVIYDDIRRVLSFVVSSAKQDIGVCRLQTEFSWR
ncbi:MAG: ABC transporter ATP-binding protein [Oscillospiraceae bacterium]|nr:ABC transporter ATP-binding protein [Oscillospiraceae bacterium]